MELVDVLLELQKIYYPQIVYSIDDVIYRTYENNVESIFTTMNISFVERERSGSLYSPLISRRIIVEDNIIVFMHPRFVVTFATNDYASFVRKKLINTEPNINSSHSNDEYLIQIRKRFMPEDYSDIHTIEILTKLQNLIPDKVVIKNNTTIRINNNKQPSLYEGWYVIDAYGDFLEIVNWVYPILERFISSDTPSLKNLLINTNRVLENKIRIENGKVVITMNNYGDPMDMQTYRAENLYRDRFTFELYLSVSKLEIADYVRNTLIEAVNYVSIPVKGARY